MYNSVKYFEEVCIKNFLELSAEFAENPNDIASYVKKVTDQLTKLGQVIIKETLEEFDTIIKESPERKEKWYVERTVEKSLITSLCAVSFNKTLYKDKKTGEYVYLLDKVMGMAPHTRITTDGFERILDEAVKTSYSRGGENVSIDETIVSKETTKKILHSLKFPEIEYPKEKKEVEYLYIDADEDHVSLQFRDKKGDIHISDNGYKNNGFITKLVYVYEGIEKEAPESTRHRLVNPYYFCGSSYDESNEELWDRVFEYIENTYDVSKIKKIFLNADGGSWIKTGNSRIAGITYVLDEFHMGKYLVKMTSHLEKRFSKDDVKGFRKILKDMIKENTREEFQNAIDYLQEFATSENEKEKIADAGDYFLHNWMAAKRRYADRKLVKGCSAEGHVSHVLSSRMSSRPMGWSKRGATQMAKLRAYYLNGGDMLELARYQEEELPMAAGAEVEKIFSAAKFRERNSSKYGEIGKWYGTIPYCELPVSVKKRFAIKNHIYNL